uniref:Uncharacterized protein n=1 Tax=Moniliophthora roreri TaxID=221103 RepID=A0A0W0G8C1_MONRR
MRKGREMCCFILPRNNKILYVSGFAEPDNSNLNFDETNPKIKIMVKNAKGFLGELDLTYTDPAYPIAKGLCPACKGDTHVERELHKPNTGKEYSSIVHSYGHADAGWSLSFGSALEVESLMARAITQEKPEKQNKGAVSQVSAMQICAFEKAGAFAKL